MILDFHNHFYPQPYLDALRDGQAKAAVSTNSQGQTVMSTDGDYSIIMPEHYDVAKRLEALDSVGVDRQCLTITVPSVHLEERKLGVRLAQIANDSFAEISAAHPNRFTALAVLPLQDPAAAAQELARAVTQGGLRGGLLFSHINGARLDEELFWPVFETAVSLDVPLMIHPFIPSTIGALRDYRLVALEGFLFDTTVAASRLVFSGVLDRFPTLKLVLAHMGGVLPFLAERLDRGFEVYPECRQKISQPPSHALRRLYMDTYPGAPKAIQFAIDFAGADKLLLGSDYPHQIGDLPGSIETVHELAISDAEKRLILGKNAQQLLKWA